MTSNLESADNDKVSVPVFIKIVQPCWLSLLWLGLLVLGAFTLMSYWPSDDYRLDIIAQFRNQYFLGSVLLCLAVGLSRRKWLSLLAVGLLLLNAREIVFIPDVEQPIEAKKQYSILSFNLYMGNRDTASVLAFIEQENPDILYLTETVHLWQRVLEPLQKKYPYRLIRWGNIENGAALYSKYPLQALPVAVTNTVASVELDGQGVLLIGCHPPSPRNQRFVQQRNRYLEMVGQYVGRQTGPVLVFGDFNCSPWAPEFKQFLAQSKLDLIAGSWYFKPTWPSNNPLIGVPIDHFLRKGNIRVITCSRTEAVGSDHYSIKMQFQLE